MTSTPETGERADFLQSLARQRFMLRNTARDLDDEQAGRRTTVSALSVGGLIKHVTLVEGRWAAFLVEGESAFPAADDAAAMAGWGDSFVMGPGETLSGLLDAFAAQAAETERIVRALPDLDASQPLPERPWHPPGTRWSARRVLLHVITEIAQHAGHADIIRESLDGAISTG